MGNNTQPHDPTTLARLREAAGLTQDQAAAFFGLTGRKRRDTIAAWEHETVPPRGRRAQFIRYLWETLGLQHRPRLFRQVWRDVMEGQWGWLPLLADELQASSTVSLPNIPFQAISEIPYFVDRRDETRAIEDCLLSERARRVCVLQGMAGVGKTALAARVAYALRPFFGDGVLWARLDTSDTMTVLRAFARAYGVDVQPYRDAASRSQVVRETLERRNCLIVLDNAENDEQIEPLLPPSSAGAAVLVTTRRPDFASLLGMTKIRVGPFRNPADSLLLFGHIIGREQVRSRQAEYEQLAEQLGHLPLALAITAGLISNLLAEGESEEQALRRLYQSERLTDLRFGDAGIHVTLGVTVAAISDKQRELLAALGAVNGEDFDFAAAAYIADKPPDTVEAVLEGLAEYSLVQLSRTGRFRLHPLVRQYTRQELTQAASFRRAAEYYCLLTGQAKRLYEAGEQIAGLELFDLEWSNIAAGQAWAAERLRDGAAELCSDYVLSAGSLLDLRLHPDEHRRWLQAALEAARFMAGRVLEGKHLAKLGSLSYEVGRLDEAIVLQQQALILLEQGGDEEAAARTHNNLGLAYSRLDEHGLSAEHHTKALDSARRLGDRKLESDALNNLGIVRKRLLQYEEAAGYLEAALAIADEMGDLYGKANTLNNLGNILLETGQTGRAVEVYGQSLDLQRQIGNRINEADVLGNLGETHLKLGQFDKAKVYYHQALTVDQELGNRYGQCYTLNGLAEVYLQSNEPDEARRLAETAVDMCREVGSRVSEADALWNLGRAHKVLGHADQACIFAKQAEQLYAEIDDPMATEVRLKRLEWECPY